MHQQLNKADFRGGQETPSVLRAEARRAVPARTPPGQACGRAVPWAGRHLQLSVCLPCLGRLPARLPTKARGEAGTHHRPVTDGRRTVGLALSRQQMLPNQSQGTSRRSVLNLNNVLRSYKPGPRPAGRPPYAGPSLERGGGGGLRAGRGPWRSQQPQPRERRRDTQPRAWAWATEQGKQRGELAAGDRLCPPHGSRLVPSLRAPEAPAPGTWGCFSGSRDFFG